MDDNTEFEIMLFNPETYTVGVEIYINDDKLDGILVLKPGQRCWLERYINENKKFKFSIYEVEDNNEHVRNAIRNNGKITVKFYKEKSNNIYTTIGKVIDKELDWWNHNLNEPLKTNPLISDGYNPSISPFTYKTTTTTNSISDDGNQIMNTRLCSTCLNDPIISSGIETYASTIDSNVSCKSFEENNISKVANKLFETGRIEKGSYSNQKFDTVYNDFETYSYKTENIKILPKSRKPYNVNDLNKVYCTNCGRKLNAKFKFCPYCGSKVE